MNAVQIHSQAQRQVVNHVMLTAVQRLGLAIDQLSSQGFTILRADLCNPSMPTITVQNDHRCHALIHSSEAAYYAFGREAHFGPYRIGQFKRAGCRVVWSEFGR